VSSPLRVVLELGQRRLLRARPSLPGSAGLAGPPVTPEAPAEIEATRRKKAAALGADPRDAWEWTACIRAYAQAVLSTGAGAGVLPGPQRRPVSGCGRRRRRRVHRPGGRLLLALGEYRGVKIVAPREFLALLPGLSE